ncbi:MAG: tRNA threonylcarbamoyladenosine dehydratase [Bacilli bacterium]|nr:tRNA threonylcarbamoyladenosine dehydratase [Bacilli bacterium]
MNNDSKRLEALIGKDQVLNLRKKTVLILGLGGVGGYVVESLARSFIGTLILVDYDTVDITNLNRQIIALHSNIGKKKTTCFKERIKDINSICNIVTIDKFINEENYLELFKYNIDYFVDACDCIKTKKLVIKYCLENNIPIISSMGTGNKMDPSKLEITTIENTINDPVARIIRKFKKDELKNYKLKVLSSTELPHKKEDVKTVASNSFVPSSAGLLITSYIIKEFTSNSK